MPTGTGLAGSVGLVEETTVGTPVTVNRFLEAAAPKFQLDKRTITSSGVRAGARVARAARRAVVSRSAKGEVALDVAFKQFGLLLKHALGTPTPTATQIATTGIYRQIHLLGDMGGRSVTWQVGVPQSGDGVVKAFTYPGGKVSEVEFSVAANEFLTMGLSVDAWDERDDIALAVPSYVASDMAHFAQVTIKVGGTASTASGLISVASGVALKACKKWTWKLANPMAADRYFLGGAGLKAEQLENDARVLTGTLDCEFADKAQIYDLFRSDAALPLEVIFTGPTPSGATGPQRITFLFPAVKIDTAPAPLDGPGVVAQPVTYTVLEDGTNAPAQVLYESTDTTV